MFEANNCQEGPNCKNLASAPTFLMYGPARRDTFVFKEFEERHAPATVGHCALGSEIIKIIRGVRALQFSEVGLEARKTPTLRKT